METIRRAILGGAVAPENVRVKVFDGAGFAVAAGNYTPVQWLTRHNELIDNPSERRRLSVAKIVVEKLDADGCRQMGWTMYYDAEGRLSEAYEERGDEATVAADTLAHRFRLVASA